MHIMGGRGLGLVLSCTILAVVLTQVEVGHATALPMELYWRTVLPNTPMPDVLRAKLHPATFSDGAVEDNAVEAAITAFAILYFYGYDNPNLHLPRTMNYSLFFPKKDLQPGTNLKMLFAKSKSGPRFLPRDVAEAMPFSSAKLSEILQFFSVDPNSEEARLMERTIVACEMPAMKGEAKYCASSLDSIIDFVVSRLGASVTVYSTTVERDSTWQFYTIEPGMKQIASSNLVVCHSEVYKYAVHYCHEVVSASAYIVPLVGEDGTRVNATVMCHDDTSSWNRNSVMLQVLKLKPGSGAVCHFNPEGHLIWVKN